MAWYLGQLKVSNSLFAIITSTAPALIGIVLAPIVSIASDRYRSALGRRIPFLIASTPIAVLAMSGLAFTPVLAEFSHQLIPGLSLTAVKILFITVFWTILSVTSVVGGVVFFGLLNDVVPDKLLGRFYGSFRAISLIDGMIFNYWLIGLAPTHYTILMFGLTVLFGAALMLMSFNVKEGIYPEQPMARHENTGIIGKIWEETRSYLALCFSSRYYLSIFVMLTLAVIAFMPINTFALLYSIHIGIGMEHYGKILALTYGISLGLAIPLGWLSDKFHPLRMAIITLALYAIVMFAAYFTVVDAKSFSVALLLHGVLSGTYLTCTASLGNRLFPKATYAQFMAGAGILTSLSSFVIPFGVGALIDFRGGDYRWTFVVSIILAALSIVASVVVYRAFKKLGGPDAYIAPQANNV